MDGREGGEHPTAPPKHICRPIFLGCTPRVEEVQCFSLKPHSTLAHQGLILIYPRVGHNFPQARVSISSTRQPVATWPALYWKGSGDRNRTGTHSWAHSLGSLMVCLSESQGLPDLVQPRGTSPDASARELRGDGARPREATDLTERRGQGEGQIFILGSVEGLPVGGKVDSKSVIYSWWICSGNLGIPRGREVEAIL